MSEIEEFKLIAKENDRVRYVPNHANGDANHEDCEDGTISSIGSMFVFVKFDKQVSKLGWHGATSQSVNPDDLRVI